LAEKLKLKALEELSLTSYTAMTLREVQEQALKLPVSDRQQLIETLQQSLQTPRQSVEKSKGLVASLIGIARTDAPPPTDEEVTAVLDERLTQKYL
jgi:hypothetical protein